MDTSLGFFKLCCWYEFCKLPLSLNGDALFISRKNLYELIALIIFLWFWVLLLFGFIVDGPCCTDTFYSPSNDTFLYFPILALLMTMLSCVNITVLIGWWLWLYGICWWFTVGLMLLGHCFSCVLVIFGIFLCVLHLIYKETPQKV